MFKKYIYLLFPWPRKANNHSAASGAEWNKTANAVAYCYGHRYQRASQYLRDLASNAFWENAELTPLLWHSQIERAVQPAQPRYVMHQSVLDALAPSVPLRAVFSRQAQV